MKQIYIPMSIDEQIEHMRKYVSFKNKAKMKRYLSYTGYFRLSIYAKYLMSYTHKIKSKPQQEMLFEIYEFDKNLRQLFFYYCKKAEIQFKTHLANSVSIHTNDSGFYLDENSYTSTKGSKERDKRNKNKNFFYTRFVKNIKSQEREFKSNISKYPELKSYASIYKNKNYKIPCYDVFNYFEMGTIVNIYSYLRGDLRKVVLKYGYTKNNYGKEVTKQVDTYLDCVRNIRNVCAHHNRLIGRSYSIVLPTYDDMSVLVSQTDIFSRVYALKKILNKSDGLNLKKDLKKIIKKAKVDIFLFSIFPKDWEERFDRINPL